MLERQRLPREPIKYRRMKHKKQRLHKKKQIESHAKSIRIETDKEVDELLQKEMKLNHQLGKQKFKGQLLADKIIKDMMKGTVFATNHLISKDTKKKRGVIETTVVFYHAQCVREFKT